MSVLGSADQEAQPEDDDENPPLAAGAERQQKLPSIKFTRFHGQKSRYEEWKREMQTNKMLYGLTVEQTAGLAYLSLDAGPDKPRSLFESYDMDYLMSKTGFAEMIRILDKEYMKEPHLRGDEAQQRYEKCRRKPFENMHDYVRSLRHARRVYEKEDQSKVSDTSFARRMLRSACLDDKEQRLVLSAAGACWDAEMIEDGLKMMFGDAHKDDRSRQAAMRTKKFEAPSRAHRSHRKDGKVSHNKFHRKTTAGVYAVDEEERGSCVEEGRSDSDAESRDAGTNATEATVEEENIEYPDSDENEVSSDGSGDAEDDVEEALETYYQGLKAKKKLRKWGFKKAPGPGGDSGNRDASPRRSSSPTKKGPDKSKSTCKDCLKQGHWAGDSACPKVQSGEKPRWKPKNATAFVNNADDACFSCGPEFEAFVVQSSSCGPETIAGVSLPRVGEESDDEFADVNGYFSKLEQMSDGSGEWEQVETKERPVEFFSVRSQASSSHEVVKTSVSSEGELRPAEAARREGVAIGNCSRTPAPEPVKPTSWKDRVRESEVAAEFFTPETGSKGYPHVYDRWKERQKPAAKPKTEDEQVHITVPTDAVDLNALTVVKLRKACGAEGLKVGGLKEDLVRRLQDHLLYEEAESPKPKPTITIVAKAKAKAKAKAAPTYLDWLTAKTEYFAGAKPRAAYSPDSAGKATCEHANIRRGANQHCAYTTCKDCGERTSYVKKATAETIYFAGVVMAGETPRRRTWKQRFQKWIAEEVEEADEDVTEHKLPEVVLFAASEVEGKMIPDTGCRRSVANEGWHTWMRKSLAAEGLKPIARVTRERFKYGGGATQCSTRSWIYPVGLYGKHGSVDIAEVPGPSCPPLLSNKAMKDMGMVLNYDDGLMDVRRAGIYDRPLLETSSGHPVLDIITFGEEKFPDEFLTFSTDNVEDEAEEVEAFVVEEKVGTVRKGAMKRLKRVSSTLQEVFSSAIDGKKDDDDEAVAAKVATKKAVRRPKILEVFTWVMMLTQMAMVGGWDACTPISLETGVDLFDHAHREKALQYIAAEDPDLTVLAPPCDPWSQIQNLNMSRPGALKKLLQKRRRHKVLLQFCKDVYTDRKAKGKVVLLEQPRRSLMLKQPEIVPMVKQDGKTDFDMCAFNLRDPYTKEKLRKRSSIITNSPAIRATLDTAQHRLTCEPDEFHKPIRGNTWVKQQNGSYKTVALSSWAGGYTRCFSRSILKAALKDVDPSVTLKLGPAPRMTPLPKFSPSSSESHGTFPVGEDLARYRRREEFAARRSRVEQEETAIHRRALEPPAQRRRVEEVREPEVPEEAERVAEVSSDRDPEVPPGLDQYSSRRARFQNYVRGRWVGPIRPGYMRHGRLGNFSLGDIHRRRSRIASTTHSSVIPLPRPSSSVPSAAPEVVAAAANPYLAAVPTAAPKRRGRPPGTGIRQRQERRAREDPEEGEEEENPAARRRLNLEAEATEQVATTAVSPEAWQQQVRDIQKSYSSRERPTPKERVVEHEEAVHLEELRRLVTEEIVVQPGGEEAGGLSQSDVDKMAMIPYEVKLEVRKAHHQLGHPAGAVLARLCKLAKKSPDHVWYARKFQCPVCLARKAPQMLRMSSSSPRPTEFNMVVAIDLKEIKDVAGNSHWMVNCLDIATKLSLLKWIVNKETGTVADAFQRGWVAPFGPPLCILHDQGPEFHSAFTLLAERYGGTCRVTATEAPWQNSMCERHGAVLGEIMDATIKTEQLEGAEDIRLAAIFATSAKNRRPDRSGYSARSRVFGSEERYPGSSLDVLLEGRGEVEVQQRVRDPVFGRSIRIRSAAQKALLEIDATTSWQAAMSTGLRPADQEWHPGSQVKYWRKARSGTGQGGRRARSFERWHGPAVILGRESHTPLTEDAELMTQAGSYWVAHNGRLLLIAREHIRAATNEERLSAAVMAQVVADIRAELENTRGNVVFEDLRPGDERAAEPEPVAAEIVEIPEVAVEVPVVRVRNNSGDEPDAEIAPNTPPRPLFPPVEQTAPAAEVEEIPMEQQAEILEPEPPEAGTYALVNKIGKQGSKGKELNPKMFDEAEWASFKLADGKNWQSHVKNGAVQIIPANQAEKIPKSLIFPVPSRFVRTSKEEQAKSRWVVPGHTDPQKQKRENRQVHEVQDPAMRTDAPVAPQVFIYMLFSYAVNHDWTVWTWDVKDAFLTGKMVNREIYVRPPREGIPGVPWGSLIKLLKGAFGLAESPRLWWLQLLSILLELGFTLISCFSASFALYDAEGVLCALLGVHVDDGVMAGSGQFYDKVCKLLRQKLHIGSEKKGQFKLLGREVIQTKELIEVHQDEYIAEIKKIYIPAARRRAATSPLAKHELTQYKSVVQQLAWVVRSTMSIGSYDVSELQQHDATPTVGDMIKANTLVGRLQAWSRDGIRLKFKKFKQTVRAADGSNPKPSDLAVAMIHDASFAQQVGGRSQQGYLMLATSSAIFDHEYGAHLIDWSSGLIHRQVRNTLAAEAACAAWAFDRMEWVRAMYGEIMHGRAKPWTENVKQIPGGLGTDCESMRSHIVKTGSSCNEKRVVLDIADLRDGYDKGDVIRWIPTSRMGADALTKHIPYPDELVDIMMKSRYSLVFEPLPDGSDVIV